MSLPSFVQGGFSVLIDKYFYLKHASQNLTANDTVLLASESMSHQQIQEVRQNWMKASTKEGKVILG